MANFHDISESVPGIVTSCEFKFVKTKVCHNILLIAVNFNKNIQEIDWVTVINLWPQANNVYI